MGLKKVRKKYKSSSPYVGSWMKWIKWKIKGDIKGDLKMAKIQGPDKIIIAKSKKKRVFLGGTCNNSTWRKKLIEKLDEDVIDYFDPVVDDWTPECMKEEVRQRGICDYVLYVITPQMEGVYSIAEVVDDSNKRPEKTLFSFLKEDNGKEFSKAQNKSLGQVKEMAEDNGAKVFDSIKAIADFLNKK
jgi:hypothetical protein